MGVATTSGGDGGTIVHLVYSHYSPQWLCRSCISGSSGRARVDDTYGGVGDHTRYWARVLLMVTSAATANVDDGLGSASVHQRWV